MLMLTRREREEVIIEVNGINISVIVSSIKGKQVRLAFDAPTEVKILRKELKELIDRAKKESDDV